MYQYKITMKDRGYKMSVGENPADAFAKVCKTKTIAPVEDPMYADVRIELIGGKRKSVSYYKTAVKTVPQSFDRMDVVRVPIPKKIPVGGALPSYRMSDLFPQGISSDQCELVRDFLYRTYGNPYMTGKQWAPEIRQLERQKSAVEMLNSLFVYGSASAALPGFKAPRSRNSMNPTGRSYYEEYLEGYVGVGGTKEEFDKFLEIQVEHYKRSRNVTGHDKDIGSYKSSQEPNEPTLIQLN